MFPKSEYFFHLFLSDFSYKRGDISRNFFAHAVAAWAEVAQIVFAFTPNSAAAERVFSMLKAMFGDQQMETLADIIQTALMLRINKRKVG